MPRKRLFTAADILAAIQSLSESERLLLREELVKAAAKYGQALDNNGGLLPRSLLDDPLFLFVFELQGALSCDKNSLYGWQLRGLSRQREIESERLRKYLSTQHSKRTSSPETIRRNAEMCRKRQENQKYWSLEQLRIHYNLGSTRAVTRILEDTEKWLRLEADLQLRADMQT